MSSPVLRCGKLLIVQCDASQRGLGAALLQYGKPIAYASRAMTNIEANYAQIENLLSIVIAMDKFHHYTFARHVIVQSDHKPLETIAPGPLWKSPKRRSTAGYETPSTEV